MPFIFLLNGGLDIYGVQYYYTFMIREQLIKMNNLDITALIEEGINEYLPGIRFESQEKIPLNTVCDAVFDIKYRDQFSYRVTAISRRNLRPSTLALIESHLAGCESQFKMLAADYITPSIADTLRTKNIWFIDMAGNIYIDIPGKVFIFNIGNKKREVEKRVSLISQANGRLFFYLLRNSVHDVVPGKRARSFNGKKREGEIKSVRDGKNGPQLTAGYRKIAAGSMVSLGKVSQTLAELKRQGIIKIKKEGIFILQSLKLLELWVETYLGKVKPHLYRGTYKWPHGADFTKLERFSGQLKARVGIGGERGGELYTGYLKPAFMDLWVPKDYIAGIKKQMKLMESQQGTVRIYSLFSNDILYDETLSKGSSLKLVHPLMVYADLLETSDTRCLETAQMVKRELLGWIR